MKALRLGPQEALCQGNFARGVECVLASTLTLHRVRETVSKGILEEPCPLLETGSNWLFGASKSHRYHRKGQRLEFVGLDSTSDAPA